MNSAPKEPNLVLAERIIDDMIRFTKDSPNGVPENFTLLVKDFKKDGKVTFAAQDNLQKFHNRLSMLSFGSIDKRGIMGSAAMLIDSLAKVDQSNKLQIEGQINNVTTQIEAARPNFYNANNPRPLMLPLNNAHPNDVKAYNKKMEVKTGFSKIYNEHVKHLPKSLYEALNKTIQSMQAKSVIKKEADGMKEHQRNSEKLDESHSGNRADRRRLSKEYKRNSKIR